ncbi:hypothetical protein CsatA_019032 [Cannabis sativa]
MLALLPKTFFHCCSVGLNLSSLIPCFYKCLGATKDAPFSTPHLRNPLAKSAFHLNRRHCHHHHLPLLLLLPRNGLAKLVLSTIHKNSNCEVCDTRAHVSSFSSFEDLNDTGPDSELDSSVGSVFMPLQPCEKMKISEPVEVEPDFAHWGRR